MAVLCEVKFCEIATSQSPLPRTGGCSSLASAWNRATAYVSCASTRPNESRAYSWPEDVQFIDESWRGTRLSGFQGPHQRHRRSARPLARRTAALPPKWLTAGSRLRRQAAENLLGARSRIFRGTHLMNACVFAQHESSQKRASRHPGGLPEEWINPLTLDR